MALVAAFQDDSDRHAEQYMALGRTKSVEFKDYLAEQTIRTIGEWIHARDESGDGADRHAQEEPATSSHDPIGSMPNPVMRALIGSWMDHWWMIWLVNEPSYIRALKTYPHALDGAEEYHRISGR